MHDDLEQRLPATLDLLRQMVAVNSWTENAEGVNRLGCLTADAFAGLGFRAERVPSTHPGWGDHLVLTRPGAGTVSLALVSHLDTVFPPEEEARNDFRWLQEGDRIYGPGTHDIKGGTALIWMMLGAMQAQEPAVFEDVTWRLFLNSSEEALSHDFGDVVLRRCDERTLAALVFEAEGQAGKVRKLVVARKGRATWCVRVQGRGAHAGGRHESGANAIVQLGRTLEKVAGLTDYARALTVNVGRVEGGGGLNRVPHEARAEGELRAFDPEVYRTAKEALRSFAGPGEIASPADGFRCQVAVEILSESRPWPRNAATDRLFALWEETGRGLGMEIENEERGGLSDGNLLWDRLPTLDGLGPGGANDHCSERTPDGMKVPEYVEVSSFIPKAALNLRALLALVRGAGGP